MGRIWTAYPFLFLGVVFSTPALASAGLVNWGAAQCGRQLVAQSGSSDLLTGQPVAPSATAACAGALQQLRLARRISPDSARAEAWLGYVNLSLQDLAGAAAAFDRSADLEPKNGATWLFAGIAYYRWGQNDVALARWERIPDSSRALTRLADRLAQQDQCAQAEAYYRLAIQQPPPGLEEAHLGLADCLYKEERFEEAALEYQAALQMGVRSDVAANRLGKLLVQLGRPREAIPWLALALEWHLYPWHMIDLAKAYESAGDLASAEYWFVETDRQFPRSPEGSWEFGNYYFRHEQYREAVSQYQRAVDISPQGPYYFYADLGRAYLSAGCPHEAAEAFAEALRGDPTNAAVAVWLNNAQEMNTVTVEGCR